MANLKSIGKYNLIRKIGEGGFGAVYLAEDTRLGGEVALKVIHSHISANEAFRHRFFEEIKTARSLGHHPNLIPIQDSSGVDGEDGMLFLAMPFIEGRTLRQRFRDEGKFTLEALLPILTQLAAGLALIHGKNVVHRDVKPENIILTREASDLQVILLDFGLVRSLDSSVDLTKSQGILGSATYISPEQVNPSLGKICPQSDVYALGVMIYELLTGAPPFDGAEKDFVAVWHDHGYTSPPPPPGLSKPVTEILLRALEKHPADRFPGAKALVEALAQVQTGRQAETARQIELGTLVDKAQKIAANIQSREDARQLLRCSSRIIELDGPSEAKGWLNNALTWIEDADAREKEQKRLQGLYAAGEEALGAGDHAGYKKAVASFEAVAKDAPDFNKDVQAKLTQARAELARAEAYDQAASYTKKEDWPAACRAWLAVLENRLDYRNYDAARQLLPAVKGLLARVTDLQDRLTARQKEFQQTQADAKQLQEILRLYDRLAHAYTSRDWPAVVKQAQNLPALAADLTILPHWLAQARAELAKPKPKPKPAPPADEMMWEKDGKAVVRVSAGEFMYGDDRKPKTLPEFWIDRTPVTNAEFARFVQATGYQTTAEKEGFGWVFNFQKTEWEQIKGADWQHPGGPKTTIKEKMDHPVVQVSWHDAVKYAEWAGKRLPTEEEWEKAARGTDGRKYPWGDTAPTAELCNFNMNVKDTTPVGQYSPRGDSPYHCVDMSGNVWEWTASDYDKLNKILRGGSWYDVAEAVRAALRYGDQPVYRDSYGGFRCVVSQANGS